MAGIYFYTLGIGFASGIFARSFFEIGYAEICWMFFLGAAMWLVWVRKSKGMSRTLLALSLGFFAFGLGAARLHVPEHTASPLASRIGETVALTGVVLQEPDVRARTTHLFVTLEGSGERVLVLVDRYTPIAYGDVIHVTGILKEPDVFETDLGRVFNYPGYLKARGVRHVVSFASVSVLENGRGNAALAVLLQFKHAFLKRIEQVLPEPAAGLGEGILLGVKRALGEDLEQTFRRAGIIHIVVLSGYNVMIVAEAVMRLLSFCCAPKVRMGIGVCIIAAFALLVGLSATVVRASVMAALVLVARAYGRTYEIMRALLFAGVVMLLLNPYLLAFDPGFQLSFLATLGLLYVAPLLTEKLVAVPTLFQVREFFIATVATQIAVLPLLLYLIGEFSTVSIFVNVLVLPIVPFAMLGVCIVGVVGFLSTNIALLFGYPTYLLLSYMIAIPEWFTSSSLSALSVPAFPFWVVLFLYGVGGVSGYFFFARAQHARNGQYVPPVYLESWQIETVGVRETAPRTQGVLGAVPVLPFR